MKNYSSELRRELYSERQQNLFGNLCSVNYKVMSSCSLISAYSVYFQLSRSRQGICAPAALLRVSGDVSTGIIVAKYRAGCCSVARGCIPVLIFRGKGLGLKRLFIIYVFVKLFGICLSLIMCT